MTYTQRFAAFTMADMEALMYSDSAEFKRGKDKKKRKRRGSGLVRNAAIGAAGLGTLAGAAYLMRRRNTQRALSASRTVQGNRLPPVGRTTGMSRTESGWGAIGNNRPGARVDSTSRSNRALPGAGETGRKRRRNTTEPVSQRAIITPTKQKNKKLR